MLSLILGRSGSGKSHLLHRQIQAALQQGKPTFLLVPEQFSFESEQNLAQSLSGPELFSLRICTFTKLAKEVFDHSDGPVPTFLDNGGRALSAFKAAAAMQDELRVFGKAVSSPGFITQLLQFFEEASANTVSPLELEQAAASLSEGSGLRLSDLAALYAGYQEILSDNVMDPTDCVKRAAEAAEKNRFFAGASFFVDGFGFFTPAQLALLKVMFHQAEQVSITITAEGLADTAGGFGVFARSHKTIAALKAAAKSVAVPIAEPILLPENKRTSSPALQALERGFLAPRRPDPVPADRGIRVITCPDVYEEAETVCALIAQKVREEGYRYQDMVVITRNLDAKTDLLVRTFEKYDIPYFMDRREPIAGKPLTLMISSLLDVLRYGFQTEDLLRCAKTGGFGLSEEALCELENYCYTWNITRGGWKQPFTLHPEGMKSSMEPEDRDKLARLEAARQALILPLLHFRSEVKSCNGKSFAAALWNLLQTLQVQKHLDDRSASLPEQEAAEQIDENHRVHNCICNLLDQFVAQFADEPMDLTRFSLLFALQSAQYSLGEVPNTLDSVLIGSAERIRTDNRSICFVTGFVQGQWPAEEKSTSLLSVQDRKSLLQLNIDLGGMEENEADRENFTAYTALTAPKDALIITCPAADRAYAPLSESRYLPGILALFTDLKKESSTQLPPALFVCNDKTLTDRTSACFRSFSQEEAGLRAVLKQRNEKELSRLKHAVLPKVWHADDRAALQSLVGTSVFLTASRVEKFFGCKFAYFAEYVLRLRQRKRAEISSLETGSLMHYVLEQAVRQFDSPAALQAQSDEEIKAFCKEQLLFYVEHNLCPPEQLSPRQKGTLTRMAGQLVLILRRLAYEFMQGAFVPYAAEMEIKTDSEKEPHLPTYELETPEGNRVSVTGVIDRVDTMVQNGKRYLRIVDYKTGEKKFRLQEVFYGLNLQMLLYLSVLWKEGNTLFPEDLFPAGILYFPAHADWTKEDSSKTKKEQLLEKFRCSGLILDDPAVISAMDANPAEGLFLPMKIKEKTDPAAAASLANMEEIGRLCDHVDKAVCKMADQLLGGEIDALPRMSADQETSRCSYCPFYSLCQNEMQDRSLPIESMDKQLFYDLLKQEAAGNMPVDPEGEVKNPWQ